MKRSTLTQVLLGLGCLVIGTESVLIWPNIFVFGGVGLLILGAVLILDSNKMLKTSFDEFLPFRLNNLFRFPRLPYFQTGVMILLIIASIFSILPSGYLVFILVLSGLAISQFILNISKENIESEYKIWTVFQFQIFIFFSTFVYVNFETSYILSVGLDFISSIFLFFAWFFEFLYLYFRLFK